MKQNSEVELLLFVECWSYRKELVRLDDSSRDLESGCRDVIGPFPALNELITSSLLDSKSQWQVIHCLCSS